MTEVCHKDKFGRIIKLGDAVVSAYYNTLMIAKVVKLSPKMVRIKRIDVPVKSWHSGEHNKYSEDLVIVNGPELTSYLLKL